MNGLGIAREVVRIAGRRGADLAEAYYSHARSVTVEVCDLAVETVKTAEEKGVGLRVIIDGRMGFAYGTDLCAGGMASLADRAVGAARAADPDEANLLPGIAGYPAEMELFDEEIARASTADKVARALSIEKAARGCDRRVRGVRTAWYGDMLLDVALCNAVGAEAAFRTAHCHSGVLAVAEQDGDTQTGWSGDWSKKYDRLLVEEVGREAARRAVTLLGARPVKTQRAALIMEPVVAADFLGVIAPMLSADAVQKGKSLFRGKVGLRVGSELLVIIDDGRLPAGIGSAPVDGEGVPTQETVLVEAGVLRGYMYDFATARRDGVSSTGNARRGFRTLPEVGPTNLYVRPGPSSRRALVEQVKRGLLAMEIMGVHTANPVSGEFSVGAAGLWVERGEPVHPVRGVAIAGNILELLSSLDAVGDDRRFFGAVGSPTLRFREVTVSGA